MQEFKTIVRIVALVIAIAALVFLGGVIGRKTCPCGGVYDQCDTLYVRDTIRDTVRLVSYRERVRVDTCLMCVVIPDTSSRRDTVRLRDSVLVEVPIEEKTYETENYRAVVSGYHPELESIVLYPESKIITRTREYSRWGIGPYVGYDFVSMKPGVGVAVTYSLIRIPKKNSYINTENGTGNTSATRKRQRRSAKGE